MRLTRIFMLFMGHVFLILSVFLTIHPLKLVLSPLNLHEKVPLTTFGHELPVGMIPLAFSFVFYLLHFRPRLSFPKIFNKNVGIWCLFSALTFLALDFYHWKISSVALNFEFFFQSFWIGIAVLYARTFSSSRGEVYPVFFYATLGIITMVNMGLWYIYWVSLAKQVYPVFRPFIDVPGGFIHQSAFLMVLGSLVLLYFPAPRRIPLIVKGLLLVSFAGVILANFSRGALLALIVLIVLKLGRKAFIAGCVAVILSGSALLIIPKVSLLSETYVSHLSFNATKALSGKFETGKDHSAFLRMVTTKYALESFASSALVGVGLGAVPRYFDPAIDAAIVSHSYIILVLAAYGLLGMLPVLLTGFSLLKFKNFSKRSWSVLSFMFCAQLFFPHFEAWFCLPVVFVELVSGEVDT